MCVCDAASCAAVVDERRVECVIDVTMMRVKEVRRGESDVDDDVAASSTAAVKERKWREGGGNGRGEVLEVSERGGEGGDRSDSARLSCTG